MSNGHDAIAHIFHKTLGFGQQNTSYVSGFFPHVKHEMFKVAVSCVSIYLTVMHMKLSVHTQAAVTLLGLMSDLLPSFTSVLGLMLR